MFDIGLFEILMIAIISLIILGPDKMPHAVRMCAAYWGRLKRTFLETKLEIEEQLELEDLKKQLRKEQAKIENLIDSQINDSPAQEPSTPKSTTSEKKADE